MRCGHLARDGEDRALGGLAHGGVGAVGGAGQRGGDEHGVDQLAGARDQLLGGAADELGEDHAGVAAGAEQRGARDGLDDLLAADLVDRALVLQPRELVDDGAQRERHVVPVSPSATGKTLRSLISWRRASSAASAPSTTARNRTRLGSSGCMRRG